MSDVIPLTGKHSLPSNNINSSIWNKFDLNSLLSDQSFLLPILFIFIFGQKGSNWDLFGEISNITNGFNGILDLSPSNVEKSLKTLNSLKSKHNQTHGQFINTTSTILETVYRLDTLGKLTKNITSTPSTTPYARSSNSASGSILDDKDFLFDIVEAVEPLLKSQTRKTVSNMRNMVKTMSTFMDMGDITGSKNTSGNQSKGGIDLSSIMGILGPLLGTNTSNVNTDSMQSILKMAEVFSSANEGNSEEELNEEESELLNMLNSISTNKKDNKKKNKSKNLTIDEEKVIDVENYDEDVKENDSRKRNNLLNMISKFMNKTRGDDENSIIDIDNYSEVDDIYFPEDNTSPFPHENNKGDTK